MSYIGRGISNLSDRAVLDSITASATATYNLLLNNVAYVPSSAESLTVSLNGVIQKPVNSYTVSGSTIVFASSLASTDSIDFILAERAITLTTIGSGTVTTSNIVDSNVTNAKLANSSITLNGSAVSLGGSATITGGLTLLQTTTVSSAVSSVTIGTSSLFSSTYDFYLIRGNLKPATNGANGWLKVRTSGGLQSSAYRLNRMWQYAGATTVGLDNATNANQINEAFGQSLSSTHGGTFDMFISQPSSTSVYKPISIKTVGFDTGNNSAQHVVGGAWTGGTDAITGIELYFNSGNVASGLITLHGVNK